MTNHLIVGKLHPVYCILSNGERILGTFTLNEDISEHLKSGGTATITIGGHEPENNQIVFNKE